MHHGTRGRTNKDTPQCFAKAPYVPERAEKGDCHYHRDGEIETHGGEVEVYVPICKQADDKAGTRETCDADDEPLWSAKECTLQGTISRHQP